MNIRHLFQKKHDSAARRRAHMTWAQSSLGASFTRTRALLRTQLWIWPIIAVVILSAVGFTAQSAIESTMQSNLQSELETLLSVEIATLTTWYEVQEKNAETMANNLRSRELAAQLLTPNDPLLENSQPSEASDENPETVRAKLDREIRPALQSQEYTGYFLIDRERQIVASSYDQLVGQRVLPELVDVFKKAADGENSVSAPFTSSLMIAGEDGEGRLGQPTMFVATPVRDGSFQTIGVLALQIRADREFTRILQIATFGESGETYAFDSQAMMVSNSRFDHDLILLGILPDRDDAKSILNVRLANPGGDMTKGFRPTQRRSELPPTHMFQSATSIGRGYDVDGYLDYRGVMVTGAWTWLPEYNIGLATEIDFNEAYRPLTILKRTFWALYALLVFSAAAIYVFTLVVSRLRREAQRAAIEAQELGQYRLEEKLGEGAMGIVYKGYHSMMRRATAIKLLSADKLNDESMARFEKEVQTTCQLNHPNTIAIYDYGRTPEGVFYYAMEYLDGIDLQHLVDEYGPQPEGRLIQILLQACGSLYEAHSMGLVHRDVKPANIMLTHRGGQPDYVKVLDFGLVRTVNDQQSSDSSTGNLAGTPLYMSPEAFQSPLLVDACSDIYSIGAVGYFLLTGQHVFEADSVIELLQKQVSEPPRPPSQLTNTLVSPELEHALLACLEKNRSRRPQTARDLAELLQQCPTARSWSLRDAEAWWASHARRMASVNVSRNLMRSPGASSGQSRSGSFASSGAYSGSGGSFAASNGSFAGSNGVHVNGKSASGSIVAGALADPQTGQTIDLPPSK
ncbi:MAG: serine/threonine protein kinase [Planctomycetaceae bacterium]